MARKQRRWRYMTMEEVRTYARKATSLSAWRNDLASPMLVSTDELAGRELRIVFESGETWDYAFPDGRHLRWRTSEAESGEDVYNASPVPGHPEVLVLHHYKAGFDVPRCTDLILDTDTGYAMAVDARIGHPDNPREVVHRILIGRIDGMPVPPGAEAPAFTQDLVGKCVTWRHPESTRAAIKYIFSSPDYYTYVMRFRDSDAYWIATNPADYVRFKPGLYVMTVIEERQTGFQLTMIMNLDIMRDVQTGFGIGGTTEEVSQLECWMRSGRVGQPADWATFV